MICASSLKREVGFICRSLFGFLDLSVSSAMACFFNCFRVGDDDSIGIRHRRTQLVSPARSGRTTEGAGSKNRLSSLFISDEEGDSPATSDTRGNLSWASPRTRKELRDEASFLKACGTLPETPGELRKASDKLKSSPSVDDGSAQSKFHSWMPTTSTEMLLPDMEADKHSTPIKSFEESRRDSISSDQAPGSCISHAQNTGNITTHSVEDGERTVMKTAVKLPKEATDASPFVTATKTQLRNKSVHFQCDSDTPSSGSSGQNLKNSAQFGDMSVSKLSTRPTPLKLSDEMQTPGTIFPVNVDEHGKVRSQYVCSVLHPVEYASQWQELNDEDHPENTEPSLNLEADVLTKIDEHHIGRTPGDRPIIGMVAAHWNVDEPNEARPKWWDGNGIPNSTTKYKEDQKVSWHATPFEERLEKALSEESSVAQKKPIIGGTSIAFDECEEESDTAHSQLPAAHSNSVVSY
ncbi:Protein JASON [Linum perenne]